MQEKQHIGALFNRIAHSYDKVNHVLSLNIDKSWRKKAIRNLSNCAHILDVAIGTGDLAIEILQKQKAQHVTGLDLSAEMMRLGAEKAARKGLGEQITFVEGSALDMPFADATFDAVTCGFGIRNFSDLDKGLREMRRVLKPNGKLVILEFSYPSNPIIRWGYNLYFSRIMPLIGRIISKDKTAYTYFYHSVNNFIWGNELAEHLANAGFQDIHFESLTFGIAHIYTAS